MDISIVTCTYNPDEKIFSRVLDAVSKLDVDNKYTFEYIIVDNNSNPPLADKKYIKDFLLKNSCAKVIVEPTQGKTHAVVKGFKESKADIIVNFDDDNSAAPDYLLNTLLLVKQYPHVAIWGPGIVKVEFDGPVETWVNKLALGFFQENEITEDKIGCDIHGDCNPIGTGMVIKREVMEQYVKNFDEGKYTNLCRTGNNLSTGGDLQIVLTAIKNKQYCGISPKLRMGHLIPAKRTSIEYISKLVYGYSSSINEAIVEVFPEEIAKVKLIKQSELVKLFFKNLLFLRSKFYSKYQFKIDMANAIGEAAGSYKIYNKAEPYWLKSMVSLFKLR
jgi:glycosyltransferase involved in cell wall biosynthesis